MTDALKPFALGDILDDLGPILWSAKALEIALLSNSAFSGKRFTADALSDLAMTVVDRATALQDKISAAIDDAAPSKKAGAPPAPKPKRVAK